MSYETSDNLKDSAFLNIFQGRLAYVRMCSKIGKPLLNFLFYLSSQGRNVMYMDSANTSVTSTTEDQRPSSRLTLTERTGRQKQTFKKVEAYFL